MTQFQITDLPRDILNGILSHADAHTFVALNEIPYFHRSFLSKEIWKAKVKTEVYAMSFLYKNETIPMLLWVYQKATHMLKNDWFCENITKHLNTFTSVQHAIVSMRCAVNSETYSNAAKEGNLELMKFLVSTTKVCWNKDTCSHAASYGHLDCLQFAHENGCPWDTTILVKNSASNGHLDCLQYTHQHGCLWDPECVIEYVVLSGSMECIKYALQHGCKINSKSLDYAIACNLECVKFVLNEFDYEKTEDYCSSASFHGKLDILTYLHENGFPLSNSVLMYAVSGYYMDCVKYAVENGCQFNNNWDDEGTLRFIIKEGNIEELKYLIENGCPYSSNELDLAIEFNKLDIVKYLTEFNPCLLKWRMYSSVVKNGQYDILKYLYEKYQDWGNPTDVCVTAARYGHIDCLRYADKHNYPMRHDPQVCNAAAAYGHVECLKYAHENGFPWNNKTYMYALESKDEKCIAYVIEHGCPKE